MKLYATTTSERASKGQGGNQYINTEFYVGDAKYPLFIGKVKLYIADEKYQLDYFHPDGEVVELIQIEQKGKKQKTAKVEKCYCTDTELSVPHYADDHQ